MRIYTIAGASLAALACQPLAAQSIASFEETGRVDTRAMVGITIPLGGKSPTRNTEPRLDFRFDTSRIDADPQRQRTLNPLMRQRRNVRATTFSLTFDHNPKLLLNGHAFASLGSPLLARFDEGEEAEKEERSTGQKILRGAGWAGIGALALVGAGAGYLVIRCSGDDSDCFDED